MTIEKIPYKGWQNCLRLSNSSIEMIITTDVGPRVLHLGFLGGANLFYENPAQAGTTGGDEWKIYGGHRFWCAPEVREFTYAPDNFPVQAEAKENELTLTASVEKSGVCKSLKITLDNLRNEVRIIHSAKNCSLAEITLAPWGLSVMRKGGTAIIPHQVQLPDRLLPTHSISFWGYTSLADPRWGWSKKYIFLKQDPAATTPQKIGVNNQYGWAAYAVGNQLFMKKFGYFPGQNYPDFNCNFEAYTNSEMLEMETLAPLVDLQPGESVSHEEIWCLFNNIPLPRSEEDVDRTILPLVNQ